MVVSRVRIPVLGYVAVVAPVLFGLLYAAESVLGPPGPMPLSTAGPVFAARTAPPVESIQVLSIPDTPEVPAAALVLDPEARAALAAFQNAPQPGAAGSVATSDSKPEVRRVAAAPKKKKPVRVAREPDEERERYAFEPRQRSFFSIW